jgi:hypothetical protein
MQCKRAVHTLLLSVLGILFCASVNAQNLSEVYVSTEADLSDFSKVILRDLVTQGAQIIPPVWVQGDERDPHKWTMSKKNAGLLQEGFQAAIKEKLEENGGYPVVTNEADGVLEIRVGLISLTPYAQRGEKVITRGTGEIRIQVTLRNAMTGVLLAIYEGDQQVGDQYQENTDLASLNDAQALFVVWGQKIRKALDDAHGTNVD